MASRTPPVARRSISGRPSLVVVSRLRPAPLLGATLLGVVGTLSVILPVFLTGAMAVQIREDLNMSDSDIGLAVGSFFVGSTAGSMILGRLAERLGPRPAIQFGLLMTIAANVAIAVVAVGSWSLIAILLFAGLSNALTQPAINLMLVRVVEPGRLGTVMALKQSGMPGAALFGGLAVPVVALTVGWRVGYLLAALIALVAVWLTFTVTPNQSSSDDVGQEIESDPDLADGSLPEKSRPRPDLGMQMLLLMAAVGVLGGGAANVLVAYLVSGAVAAGVAPGPAGLLLTLGSALGIASRLINGWLADRQQFDVLRRVIWLLAIGAGGGLGLAIHQPMAYLLATPFAFAAGWAWPGLFNLVVVKANRSAPAAATGITQTGVYAGSLASPILAGLLIERSGYGAAWLLTAASLAGAGLLAALVRSGMDGDVESRVRSQVESTGSTG